MWHILEWVVVDMMRWLNAAPSMILAMKYLTLVRLIFFAAHVFFGFAWKWCNTQLSILKAASMSGTLTMMEEGNMGMQISWSWMR
jgi:hypothetical protein